jgi:hypothetical protein
MENEHFMNTYHVKNDEIVVKDKFDENDLVFAVAG